MNKVRYERFSLTGKTRCEATLEVGAFGFAGRGSTYAEAYAELMHRLEMHRVNVERAVEEARASTPPADHPAAE